MKRFCIATFVLPAAAAGFLLLLEARNANADFTFGEPVRVGSIVQAPETIDCLSCDGLEMYINSDRAGGQGSWDFWVLKRNSPEEDWGPPENLALGINRPEDLGLGINSAQEDSFGCISADGLAFYFTSNRPGGYGKYDIYMATRTTKESPWGLAMNLGPPINSSATDGEPWISPDGLELYFESYRGGGYGSADIYVSRRATTKNAWGPPVNLGPVVNTQYSEQWHSLSPDGRLLLFCEHPDSKTFRPGGYGGSDLWMARRATLSDPWQTPVNLGPIVNTPFTDAEPRISPDGRTLYFWSNRSAGYQVWQTPILPIRDFNGDGKVDEKDMALLVADWGQGNSVCDIGPFPWGDGVVDEKDLTVLVESLLTPGARASEVSCGVVLSWVSPSFASACDVYFGTSREAVTNADRAHPQGVLVSQAQTTGTYDPEGLLDFSRTYYWRVDFVVSGPAPTIYRGPVLDFTTEAFVYPIKNVTATTSSVQRGMGPERTVDGSGLDQNDLHGTDGATMWFSAGGLPDWIQYQFDRVYALHELWVWNSNQPTESVVGFGAKTVRIEYSTDGTKWTQLADVPEFARAPGQDGYVHNTTISFGGISARYVKLTIEKNWGAAPATGLSEVRFFYVPDRSAPKP